MPADVQKVIEILFSGNDQVSGVIDTIGGKVRSFGDGVGNITGPLASVTDSILKLDAALAALAAGGLAYAFLKSSEFESSLIELEKVLGNQPAALEAASKEAFRLSNLYGESSSTALLSAADFKQAGFDIEGSLKLTKNAMDLVIAGNIESSTASQLLVSTLKGFKAPAEDAARLIDILNEVSNNYATNVQELAVGMADLSPIAKLMGFSFEETAGVLTPVIEIFRSGSEASIALRTGLLQLINDSKPVSDGLKAIGVSQKNANGTLRSGKEILTDVATAFQSVDEDQKLFFASQLVGIRQAARMVEVFDGLNKTQEITRVAMNAAGSATEEVAKRLQSAEVIVNRFKVGFENLSITIGDQFLESAKTAIAGGTELEQAIQQLVKDGQFDPLFDIIREAGDEIGEFLTGVAKALPEAFEGVNFDGLIAAIAGLGGEFGKFFSGLDLTKPQDLEKAIQFVVDSIESLIRTTSGIVGPLGKMVEQIISLVDAYNNLSDETKKTTGETLGWGKVVNSLLGPLGSLLKVAESLALAFNVLVGVQVVKLFKSMNINIGPVVTKLASLQGAVGMLAGNAGMLGLAAGIGVVVGSLIRLIPGVDTATQKIIGFIDRLFDISEYPTEVEIEAQIKASEKSIAESRAKIAAFQKEKAEKEIELKLKANDEVKGILRSEDYTQKEIEYFLTGDTDALKAAMEEANILVEGSVEAAKKEFETLQVFTEGGTVYEVQAKIAGIDDVKKEIEEIPTEKLLEIKLQGEIDTEITRIKTEADLVQKALEWTAKINVAEVETAKAAFESLGSTVRSITDNVGSMFSILAGAKELSKDIFFRNAFQEQVKIQKELVTSQIQLNQAQEEYINAKAEALRRNKGLITITADGLEPELEAFMWRIIEKVQIRATESASEFLLGFG